MDAKERSIIAPTANNSSTCKTEMNIPSMIYSIIKNRSLKRKNIESWVPEHKKT